MIFISGERFFRSIPGVDERAGLDVVQETLKFPLIPAFIGGPSADGPEWSQNK